MHHRTMRTHRRSRAKGRYEEGRDVTSAGIGVIFNTRKGTFQYKISLYIIIYLEYIIVYHVYHRLVSDISCPSSTHDISDTFMIQMHDMIYDDITRLLKNMIPT